MQTPKTKQALSRRKNAIRRAELIQQMVEELHEPGNQSKSKAQVYRYHVRKVYPIGERTFWRYMGIDVAKEREKLSDGQLTLKFGN